MKTPRSRHTRHFRAVAYVAVGFAILGLGAWFFYYSFVTQPQEMRMQGRSWRELSFLTNLNADRRPTRATLGDLTGAGIIEGTTQYLGLSVLGFPEPPAPLTGSMRVVVEDVEITLIGLGPRSAFVSFNTADGGYFVRLWTKEPFEFIDYRAPFEEIPEELSGSIVYRSTQPETLIIETPTNEACCRHVPPVLNILTNTPSSVFSWNLRRGCSTRLSRGYDVQSNSLNNIHASEICPDHRDFMTPADRTLDSRSRVVFRVFDIPGQERSALVLPRSFSLQADGMPRIDDAGTGYLVLLRAPKGILDFEARPQSKAVYLHVHPANTSLELMRNDPLLLIEPNSKKVAVEGMVGKVAVGLETTATDELSSMVVEYRDWPSLRWTTEFLVDDIGSVRQQHILSNAGRVSALVVNGEELVKNRWQQESPEIRGAIIAGAIALMTSLLVAAWDSKRKKQTDQIKQIATVISSAPDNQSTPESLKVSADSSVQVQRSTPILSMMLAGFIIIVGGWISREYFRLRK